MSAHDRVWSCSWKAHPLCVLPLDTSGAVSKTWVSGLDPQTSLDRPMAVHELPHPL